MVAPVDAITTVVSVVSLILFVVLAIREERREQRRARPRGRIRMKKGGVMVVDGHPTVPLDPRRASSRVWRVEVGGRIPIRPDRVDLQEGLTFEHKITTIWIN